MDRRNFITSLLAAPALTPVLLASQRHHAAGELYLIADDPHNHLPSILTELTPSLPLDEKTFTFSQAHPLGDVIQRSLERSGWRRVSGSKPAAMTLSFRAMHGRARPSFSLVRNGRVWDVRTRRLMALWENMNRKPEAATVLTTAAFHRREVSSARGGPLILTRDGARLARIPLDQDSRRTFRGGRGSFTVEVADHRAWIAEASCRHKICMYSPPISLPGERIICAPNRVLLEVSGPGGVDTVIG